jgi:hypothetical protein
MHPAYCCVSAPSVIISVLSMNNRRLWVLKQLRDRGLVPDNQVLVKVRPPADTRRLKDKFTPERCSLHARFMHNHVGDGPSSDQELDDETAQSSTRLPVDNAPCSLDDNTKTGVPHVAISTSHGAAQPTLKKPNKARKSKKTRGSDSDEDATITPVVMAAVDADELSEDDLEARMNRISVKTKKRK